MAGYLFRLWTLAVLTLQVVSTVAIDLYNRQSSIAAADPFDHSWIDQWASLGDSFSVGLGAGSTMKEADNIELNPGGFFKGYCYQYTDGYGHILNEDGNLGVNPGRKFQYLGCSGAVASNILSDQVPLLKSPQIVTLSAGGNDADFASILNWCIYQWFAPSIWSSCDQKIGGARETINSDAFLKDLTNLINVVKDKPANSNGRVFWVGYAKFFDTLTKECDSVTWAVRTATNEQYLTQARRQAMNDVVDAVNDKIKSVVSAAGPQVVFVDWQSPADQILGRYCEPGVNETWDREKKVGISMNREQTVFYEWGTDKDDGEPDVPAHGELRKRQDITASLDTPAANMTFKGAIANYIKASLQQNPDLYNSSGQDLGFSATGSWLSDKYGRTFHPTRYGNDIIAASILKALTEEQAKLMNQPAITTTITGPAVAAATAAPSATPSATTGAQCHGVSGSMWIANRTVVMQNIADFCKQDQSPQEYNKNTTNDVRLTVTGTGPVTKSPDCTNTFIDKIISDCDSDPINNPQKYVYGGSYTTPDGWMFKLEPLFNQTDEDNCDVSYQFLFDSFQVRGKNFPDAELGVNGRGLEKQIKGCGDLNDWGFEYTPNDVKFQWYAHGRLPIGTKACVGRAVLSAGGSSVANCHGSG